MLLPLLLAAGAWGLLKTRLATPARRQYAVHENLMQSFLFGEFVATTGRINLGSPRGQKHTTEADPRRRSQARGVLTRGGGKPPFALVVGREARVDLDVNQIADRRLVLRVGSALNGRPQRVSVSFNGEPLGSTPLRMDGGPALVRHEVPAELQRRGVNRVLLTFDEIEPVQLHELPFTLPLSGSIVSCYFLRPGEPEDVPPRADGGVRSGVSGAPGRAHESRRLTVAAGVSARLALQLPPATRVVLSLRVERVDTPLELSLVSDDGRRTRLALIDPRDVVPRELLEDLTPWAGRVVQLDLLSHEGEGRALLSELSVLIPNEEDERASEREQSTADAPEGRVDGRASAAPADTADTAGTAGTAQDAAASSDTALPGPLASLTGLQRPDVLVIVLDALARGRSSAFGAELPTTPVLEQLCRRATVAARAQAPASYTVASVGSLLTGLHPMVHGVVLGETPAGPERVADSVPRLAEQFAAAGWRTAAWLTNPNTSARYGFGKGFEQYHELFADETLWEEGVDGAQLAPRLQAFLSEPDDAPRFSWVHVFEPHAPWRPTAGLAARFVTPYQGEASGEREFLDQLRTGFIDPASLGPLDLEHLSQVYAARMARADGVLGELLSALEASGRAERTLVLVTADHGEAIGEHGRFEHGDDVHAEQLDVPWVLLVPGRAPVRLQGPVTLMDVAPTLLSLAGLEPLKDLDGIDLSSEAPERGRTLLSRGYGTRPMLGLTRGHWRLTFDVLTRRRALYDIRRDPGERSDLADARPVTTAFLHAELCRAVADAVGRADAGVDADLADPERLAVLRSLGYVGADASDALRPDALVLAALRAGLVRD